MGMNWLPPHWWWVPIWLREDRSVPPAEIAIQPWEALYRPNPGHTALARFRPLLEAMHARSAQAVTLQLADSLPDCTVLAQRECGESRREIFLYIPYDGIQRVADVVRLLDGVHPRTVCGVRVPEANVTRQGPLEGLPMEYLEVQLRPNRMRRDIPFFTREQSEKFGRVFEEVAFASLRMEEMAVAGGRKTNGSQSHAHSVAA